VVALRQTLTRSLRGVGRPRHRP